jgi:flavin-dependent dehydrogenase
MKTRSSGLGPLPDGGRIVILGGGPAGTATAIALLAGGRTLGRDLHVTVVEGKQFMGEHHYNQCAGVLAPPIMELLEDELCVPFPNHLSRTAITGYVLHTPRREIILDDEAEHSVALRRVQFDAYMLEAAQERGAQVLSARATGLELHADGAVVYTESTPLEADVLVGAFGLDEGTAAIFGQTTGYRSPPALSSVVTKYHPGETGMSQFGRRIHAFLPATPHIEFGAIAPKGNHLTINIAGAGVNARLMDAYLAQADVRRVLPNLESAGSISPGDLQYFKGRFPRGLARNTSGDRFVTVGDAAGLVRAFKGKGVTSAIQTGIRAAHTILHQGISSGAFQTYHTANRDITDDLPFGQAMRHFTILASRLGLMDAILKAAGRDALLRRALFDAVSAYRPYREVLRQAITPASVREVLAALI